MNFATLIGQLEQRRREGRLRPGEIWLPAHEYDELVADLRQEEPPGAERHVVVTCSDGFIAKVFPLPNGALS